MGRMASRLRQTDVLPCARSWPPGPAVVVEGEYVEPVQLQVICSDIWESAAGSEKVISRQSLPKDWSVDVGLGRFYDQAIEFACRPPAEPTSRSSSLGSRLASFVGWRSFSPIQLRKWVSKSLITAMGTRAPVLVHDAETGVPPGVLERLENRYLLRLEPRFGADWLELAHDRLVGPIARSNARHIAAANHSRVRIALLALFVVGAAALWEFAQRQAGTIAREAHQRHEGRDRQRAGPSHVGSGLRSLA